MTTLLRPAVQAVGGESNHLPQLPAGGCFGDGCDAVDPWPVHQIRHRNNVFLRLCTSCVLKNHPGSFCFSCFEVFDPHDRPLVVHCSKCPSVSHLSCLPDPNLAPLCLCPPCDSPSSTSFSYFPYSKDSENKVIDLRAAKILLAAARLSAASMTRAAAIARVDAEKKVKESALARKRAKEMLDRSLLIFEKQKAKIRVPIRAPPTARTVEEMTESKKKAPICSMTVGAAAQKRAQDREREKWRRFSEPVGFMNRSALEASVNDMIKGRVNSELADGIVKDDGEKKGVVVSDAQIENGGRE